MKKRQKYLVPMLVAMFAGCSSNEPQCLDAQGQQVACTEGTTTFIPSDLTCQDGSGNEVDMGFCQQTIAGGSNNSTSNPSGGISPFFFFWSGGGGGGARYPATSGYPQIPYSPTYNSSVPRGYTSSPTSTVEGAPRVTTPRPSPVRSGIGTSGRSNSIGAGS
jgi:hypothetical protein